MKKTSNNTMVDMNDSLLVFFSHHSLRKRGCKTCLLCTSCKMYWSRGCRSFQQWSCLYAEERKIWFPIVLSLYFSVECPAHTELSRHLCLSFWQQHKCSNCSPDWGKTKSQPHAATYSPPKSQHESIGPEFYRWNTQAGSSLPWRGNPQRLSPAWCVAWFGAGKLLYSRQVCEEQRHRRGPVVLHCHWDQQLSCSTGEKTSVLCIVPDETSITLQYMFTMWIPLLPLTVKKHCHCFHGCVRSTGMSRGSSHPC